MLTRLIFAGALLACMSPGVASCAQAADISETLPVAQTPAPSAPDNPASQPPDIPAPQPEVIDVAEPDVTNGAASPIPTDMTASPPSVDVAQYACPARAVQGGLIICALPAGAHVYSNGVRVADADASGRVAIGLRRNAERALQITWDTDNSDERGVFTVEVAPRQDEFRELSGLECDKVDARTPEQLAHAGRSWTQKVKAFAQVETPVQTSISFRQPASGPFSSPFGPTRHYTGVSAATGETCEKTSVHRGLDIATPVGTPLYAPMGGTVTLADPDLYYEGGTIFLDHGLGLVSVFMHLSKVDVAVGDVVAQGDLLGATGNTGRTTGPHLHWAVKWRNLANADRGGDFYIDPKLLLNLPEDTPMAEAAPVE